MSPTCAGSSGVTKRPVSGPVAKTTVPSCLPGSATKMEGPAGDTVALSVLEPVPFRKSCIETVSPAGRVEGLRILTCPHEQQFIAAFHVWPFDENTTVVPPYSLSHARRGKNPFAPVGVNSGSPGVAP